MVKLRSFHYFRSLVSGNKKRYVQDGFNLDLSYITERIIAMGYPADSVHRVFRNDIQMVSDFFENYHKGHWKILNVAREISYNHTKLGNNVVIMSFEDHSPPPFKLLLEIMQWLDMWIKSDPQNVVAVHCKAGKGRTGTIICSYLIYMLQCNCPEIFDSSDSILTNTINFFNSMRSNGGECVTVPSQKRYIGYYIQYLKGLIPPSLLSNPPIYRISNIEICSHSSITSIEIHKNYNPHVRSLPIILHKNNVQNLVNNDKYMRFEPNQIMVEGDVMMRFNTMDSSQCICRLFFHTSFITSPDFSVNNYTSLIFPKAILDGPSHGALSEDNRVRADFQINVHLEAINHPQQQQQTSFNTIQQQAFIYQSGSRPLTHPQMAQPQSNNQLVSSSAPPPVPDRCKKPMMLSSSTSSTSLNLSTSSTPTSTNNIDTNDPIS